MSVAVAITSIVAADPSGGLDSTRTRQIVEGTLTLTGNYGTGSSHGDTMDLTSPLIQSDYNPVWIEFRTDVGAGAAPLGYGFQYASGTTPANGVLQITKGGTEFTQGNAYSTGTPSLNNAVIRFRAAFAKMV